VTNNQEQVLQSEPEMRARMLMLLAGRGAERLALGTVSSGAANDLEHASNMAYRMVTELGFGATLGPFSYAGLPERARAAAPCQDAIAEARSLIRGLEIECGELLVKHRRALDLLTARLLEHETVAGGVVDECLAASDLQLAA
jgi:cell division protease FtsH